jgi:hypothetical protein
VYGLPRDFDGAKLVGRQLLQVCFGLYQLQLHFDGELSISVESAVAYKEDPNEELTRVSIPDLAASRPPLLHLLHHKIVNALGDDKGTLTLEFDNRQVLQCLDEGEKYESYQINIGKSLIIV